MGSSFGRSKFRDGAAAAVFEFDLALRQTLLPDHDLIGNSDQVGVIELDAGALIPVIH